MRTKLKTRGLVQFLEAGSAVLRDFSPRISEPVGAGKVIRSTSTVREIRTSFDFIFLTVQRSLKVSEEGARLRPASARGVWQHHSQLPRLDWTGLGEPAVGNRGGTGQVGETRSFVSPGSKF